VTPSLHREPICPERALVVGCGLSGEAVAARLARDGAAVTVSDSRPEAAIGAAAGRVRRLGAVLETGGHNQETFRGHDLIIVSPGVPLDIEVLREARERGARIVSEVEYAFSHLQGSVAGITGTNGKSTATRLLGEILAAAGRRVTVCGNIGVPFTAALEQDSPETIHCVELSSFQLEGIESFRPRVAILLNVRPDHQDRYAGFNDYAAAKARIFSAQDRTDHAVLNAADPAGMALRDRLRSRVHLVDTGTVPTDGAGLDDDWVTARLAGAMERIMPRREIPLAGAHNLENVLACALTARLLGADPEAIRNGVRGFRGLPHRLERLDEIDRVTWWNDSKATNVDAVRRALEAFPGGVVLILGGRDKGGDFAPLRDPIRERVRHLILMGEAAAALRPQVGDLVPTATVAGLDEAVAEARRRAGAGDAVLLSPGCASFDAYANFQDRGEHFRRLVDALRREAGR
jgi:UDP-N-acetylmuramoylalanine--D-glutamate ligase